MEAAREIDREADFGGKITPANAVTDMSAIIQRHFQPLLAKVEGERDAAKIELGAARNGITAWIGDIQSFNVALGLIPAAHRTETLEAISALRTDLAAAKETGDARLESLRSLSNSREDALERVSQLTREAVQLKADLAAKEAALADLRNKLEARK